ncbi:SDR family oxidoreductase [Hyphomicrobium sp. 1Nfss2.1]|uniref:SDR family oxidoreductase n=1 Tax=Hyphomicrobium sp. 1Nfss2.1 TaxID=3413936 RepID=UPI003C7B71FD
MLMTVMGRNSAASYYGELAGVRVLITGLSPECGVDIARKFADHRGRLVLHTTENSPELDAVTTILAETASEVKLFTDACRDSDSSIRFAQTAAQAFGGLDVVVNLVPINMNELQGRAGMSAVEDLVAEKLMLPVHVTRIVANRMRTMLNEGLVLNVMTMPVPSTAAEAAFAGIARSALAAVTRGEAQQWAQQGIRVNAIAPSATMADDGGVVASEPDIAALTLYLASRPGRKLTGQIFDAAGIARKGC